MKNAFKEAIKKARLEEESKFKEGYRYKVQYMDKTTRYFKTRPSGEDINNAFMISNIIMW